MRTINEWLGSEETGEPFVHCICCRFPLLEIAEPWLINKEFQRGECVLEYAICQPCRDAVTDKLSEESKRSVRNFLECEIDWEARIQEFMQSDELTDRFSTCIACHAPPEDSVGYGISALYDSSGSLVTGPLPLLICQPCIHQMTANLSDESLAVWRRFLEINFPGPPGETGYSGLL
jgi:hypothetical protein